MTLELGVLVSGSGSNLQAILDAIQDGRLDARCRLVLSNRADAYALTRAQKAGVPTTVLQHKDFPDRESFDRELVRALQAAGVEWVALAGFMRLLTPTFLDAFPERIVNIHPSLLPSFPGVNAQKQAFDYGVSWTGCTVHFVTQEMDSGPILIQRPVQVLPEDTASTLQQRILQEEHQAFVEALSLLAAGRVRLVPTDSGRQRVLLSPSPHGQEL